MRQGGNGLHPTPESSFERRDSDGAGPLKGAVRIPERSLSHFQCGKGAVVSHASSLSMRGMPKVLRCSLA